LVLASIEYSFRRVRMVEATIGATTAPAHISEQQVSTSKPTNDPTHARIARASIAVMPFVNVSSDHEQEYFADGTLALLPIVVFWALSGN
jgi:hypothetical protein